MSRIESPKDLEQRLAREKAEEAKQAKLTKQYNVIQESVDATIRQMINRYEHLKHVTFQWSANSYNDSRSLRVSHGKKNYTITSASLTIHPAEVRYSSWRTIDSDIAEILVYFETPGSYSRNTRKYPRSKNGTWNVEKAVTTFLTAINDTLEHQDRQRRAEIEQRKRVEARRNEIGELALGLSVIRKERDGVVTYDVTLGNLYDLTADEVRTINNLLLAKNPDTQEKKEERERLNRNAARMLEAFARTEFVPEGTDYWRREYDFQMGFSVIDITVTDNSLFVPGPVEPFSIPVDILNSNQLYKEVSKEQLAEMLY